MNGDPDRDEIAKMRESKWGPPGQHQDRQPGHEAEMEPQPLEDDPDYRAADKLKGRVALITGGDSGIGRAVAVAYAKEGADVAIVYLDEHEDAEGTKALVEKHGRRCLLIAGDVGEESFCKRAVERTAAELGRLDILVNNAAEQHEREGLESISTKDLERVFRTNIFSHFHMTKHALRHLGEGASVINTTSITAYKGNPTLLDYSVTKGAIVAFTRSLSLDLIKKGIRVNAVAPGPVWTPLIPASFSEDRVEDFGKDYPHERPAQPEEIAPTYVFLASEDSRYYSGQVLHPNGGKVVNG